MQVKTITIAGELIKDIPTFFEAINNVFMLDENWKIGNSLDAFDDLLHGNYGLIKGNEPIKLIWTDAEKNKKELGVSLTRVYYLKKLENPDVFNEKYIRKKLEELNNGTGQTYFEILTEIILEHKNINLILL